MLFSLEATVQGLSLCQSCELHWTCADTLEETRASDTSEEKTSKVMREQEPGPDVVLESSSSKVQSRIWRTCFRQESTQFVTWPFASHRHPGWKTHTHNWSNDHAV